MLSINKTIYNCHSTLSNSPYIPSTTPLLRRYCLLGKKTHISGLLLDKAEKKYLPQYSNYLKPFQEHHKRHRFACIWGMIGTRVFRHFITHHLQPVINNDKDLSLLIKTKCLVVDKVTKMVKFSKPTFTFLGSLYMQFLNALLLFVFIYTFLHATAPIETLIIYGVAIFGFLIFSFVTYHHYGIKPFYLAKKYQKIIKKKIYQETIL